MRIQKWFRSADVMWALAVTLVAVLGASQCATAQGIVTPPTEGPVSFTADQADRGKRDFVKHCVECHGEDLKGGLNGGAPLRGQQFEMKFGNGAPASALFLFMSTLMPPDNPGRFSAATYADIMAYVLDRNRFRAGGQELPSDIDALDNLIIAR